MNAKEWLISKIDYFSKGEWNKHPVTVDDEFIASQMEEYASYKTKELEDKIQSFRELLYSKLAKEQNWDLGDIYLEFDKYFNTKEQ